MREFFDCWRRKAGCVTLVMAVVYLAVSALYEHRQHQQIEKMKIAIAKRILPSSCSQIQIQILGPNWIPRSVKWKLPCLFIQTSEIPPPDQCQIGAVPM